MAEGDRLPSWLNRELRDYPRFLQTGFIDGPQGGEEMSDSEPEDAPRAPEYGQGQNVVAVPHDAAMPAEIVEETEEHPSPLIEGAALRGRERN